MEKETQEKKLLKALQQGERLTGLEIIERFRILNYKGRIHDLRRHGHPFRSRMISTQTGARIAEYSLQR